MHRERHALATSRGKVGPNRTEDRVDVVEQGSQERVRLRVLEVAGEAAVSEEHHSSPSVIAGSMRPIAASIATVGETGSFDARDSILASVAAA